MMPTLLMSQCASKTNYFSLASVHLNYLTIPPHPPTPPLAVQVLESEALL